MNAVRARPSRMFLSAAQSIEAGISLLALQNVSQSLLLLTQAAEVSLKGLVHEIKLLGISAWAAQNPILIRNRAKSGSNAPFDEPRFKQIVGVETFISSFREVSEFMNFSENVHSSIAGINSARNEIAHQGGDTAKFDYYLAHILFGVLPLLDEIYLKALGITLCGLIYHPVSRELIVAGRYLRNRKAHTTNCWATALRTMHYAYFENMEIKRGMPSNEDKNEFDYFEWECKVKRNFSNKTEGNVLDYCYTQCKICGHRCFVSTEWEKKADEQGSYFNVLAIACPYCHLEILDEGAELARLHYGPIDKESLGAEDWDRLMRDLD
jgi:hypothetical protein